MEYFLAIGDAAPCEPWSFGGCAGSVAARTANPLLEVATLGLESWLCCVKSAGHKELRCNYCCGAWRIGGNYGCLLAQPVALPKRPLPP